MNLTIKDFANLVGDEILSLPKECVDLMEHTNLEYERMSKEEQENILLTILKEIDRKEWERNNLFGIEKWEKGWEYNLNLFRECNYKIDSLYPKYVLNCNVDKIILRLRGEYIKTKDNLFEVKWYTIYRHWFFKKFLSEQDHIYEFGCGSCYNIPILVKLFPEKIIYGLDWAESSINILKEMQNRYKWKLEKKLFDMFNPDYNYEIKPNSAILTMGGLEQLGNNFESFLNYICASEARICVHMEPLVEEYDDTTFLGYVAKKFHKKRNYVGNFVGYIEKNKKNKILKVQKVHFGSRYQDSYCYVVWIPNYY